MTRPPADPTPQPPTVLRRVEPGTQAAADLEWFRNANRKTRRALAKQARKNTREERRNP